MYFHSEEEKVKSKTASKSRLPRWKEVCNSDIQMRFFAMTFTKFLSHFVVKCLVTDGVTFSFTHVPKALDVAKMKGGKRRPWRHIQVVSMWRSIDTLPWILQTWYAKYGSTYLILHKWLAEVQMWQQNSHSSQIVSVTTNLLSNLTDMWCTLNGMLSWFWLNLKNV